METTAMIQPPSLNEFESQGSLIEKHAHDLVIHDNPDYEAAAQFLNQIKTVVNKVEREFDGTEENPGPVKLTHRAWKAAVALRDKVLSRFTEAERVVKDKLGAYQMEQNRKRQEEAERMAAEAQKKAEDERLEAAAKAEQAGDKEAAEELLNAPIAPVVTPVTTPEAPKVKGVSFKTTWDFTIVDADKLPRKYLTPDLASIRKVVAALGKNADIPGVSIFEKPIIGSRGAP